MDRRLRGGCPDPNPGSGHIARDPGAACGLASGRRGVRDSCIVSIEDGFAWFLARVWPDLKGVPTVVVFEWERQAGEFGPHVETFHFGPEDTFAAAIARRYYELAPDRLNEPVRPDGVLIPLRKETVPVPVYAREPVYA